MFEVGRYDAEYLAKIVGKVDPEEVKRDPKTDKQHELFSTLTEQWEKWIDELRFQPDRSAILAIGDEPATKFTTLSIPPYATTNAQIEDFYKESLSRYGIPYQQASREILVAEGSLPRNYNFMKDIPAYETISE